MRARPIPMLSDPRLLPTAALLLILTLAGCGDSAPPEPSTPPRAATTSTTPTTTTTTTPPSDATKKTRLVGEITSVGECVVLSDDNGVTWTLAGEASEDLEVGDRVQAIGMPDLLATGCGGPLITTSSITVTG